MRFSFITYMGHKKVSEYDQEIHNHKLQTNPRHREEELCTGQSRLAEIKGFTLSDMAQTL